MSHRLIYLFAVILPFSVITTLALMDVGYIGVLKPHFQTWGGGQVFMDLVILALLSCIWMVYDSKKQGLPVWPFLLITLVVGAFGPLLYLVVREFRPDPLALRN